MRFTLNSTLDKILATHRNTKLLMFMLTWPFFVGLSIFKGCIKLSVLALIFLKRNNTIK